MAANTGHLTLRVQMLYVVSYDILEGEYHEALKPTPTGCHSEELSDEESQNRNRERKDSSLPSVVQNDKRHELSE